MPNKQDKNNVDSTAGNEDFREKSQPLPLLRTKLHKPPIDQAIILRESLVERLDNNLDKPLTLVSAPAGFGKSVSVSQWLDKTSAVYCWIALDEEQDDLRIFLTYLVAAVERALPEKMPQTNILLKSDNLPSLEVISRTLINELDRIEEHFIIVLDDYHTIEAEQVHELINNLLTYPPENVHLVLITRWSPPLRINQLRMHGKLNELRMKDLAFSEPELQKLSQVLLNEQLPPEVASELLMRTGGWVFALRMSLQLFDNEKPNPPEKNASALNFQNISELIIEELINKYLDNCREALFVSSILDRFNHELLDHVLKAHPVGLKVTGASLLEELVGKNLFLEARDEDQTWFGYHNLYQETLQHGFENTYSREQREAFYLQASQWYEERHLIEEAIRYARIVEAYDRVAGIIRRYRLNLENVNQYWQVAKWIDRIPGEIVLQQPELLLASLTIYRERFQIEKMVSAVQHLDLVLPPDSDQHRELSLFKGYLSLWIMGKPREAIVHLDHAEPFCRQHLILFYGYAFYVAVAYQMAGEKVQGLEKLKGWIEDPANQEGLVVFHLRAIEIFVQLLSGSFQRATDIGQSYLMAIGQSTDQYSAGFGYYLAGNAAFQQYKLRKACGFLQEGVRFKYQNHQRTALDAYFGLVLARVMQQNYQQARQVLRAVWDFLEGLEAPSLAVLVASCVARCQLLQGDWKSALSWAEDFEQEPNLGEAHFMIEVPSITRARIFIGAGNPDQITLAIEELAVLGQVLTQFHNRYHLADILVLQSIGYYKLGKHKQSIDLLEQALELSREAGALRTFVEPGEDLLELLDKVSNQKKAAKIRHLIRKKGGDSYRGQGKFDFLTQEAADTIKISLREREVIEFASKGLRSKEIAEELNVSPETVKSHFHHIFKKLKVSNRIEMLQRARKLNLLLGD